MKQFSFYELYFRKVGIIGSGSFGQVVKVIHHIGDIDLNTYAIKQIPIGRNQKPYLLRALNEVQTLQKLQHDNIVKYNYCFIEDIKMAINLDEGQPCLNIVLEYCKGGSLENLLPSKLGRQLNEIEFKHIVLQCLAAINHLHKQGMLHRDIKLSNFLLTGVFPEIKSQEYIHQVYENSAIVSHQTQYFINKKNFTKDIKLQIQSDQLAYIRHVTPQNIIVKLSDFGQQNEQGGVSEGTEIFMSQKVRNGDKHTQQSDLYALGISLMWLLTETQLDENVNQFQQQVKREFNQIRFINKNIKKIINNMIENDSLLSAQDYLDELIRDENYQQIQDMYQQKIIQYNTLPTNILNRYQLASPQQSKQNQQIVIANDKNDNKRYQIFILFHNSQIEIILFCAGTSLLLASSFIIYQKLLLVPDKTIFAYKQIGNNRIQLGNHQLQGLRSSFEDRHMTMLNENWAIAILCDGHVGSKAASFVTRNFYNEFNQQVVQNSSTKDAIKATVNQLEIKFLQQAKQFGLNDGTTLTGVIISQQDILYSFNLGDSRTIASQNGHLLELTQDHKPEDFKAYIEAAGGSVHPQIAFTDKIASFQGPDRIYPGGLSLAKSIGDIYMKDMSYLHSLGVVRPLIQSNLDIKKLSCVNMNWILLACDGLFDVLSSEEVYKIVTVLLFVIQSNSRYDFLSKLKLSPTVQRYNNTADLVCKILTEMALNMGSTDNISCVLLLFDQQYVPKYFIINQLKLHQNQQNDRLNDQDYLQFINYVSNRINWPEYITLDSLFQAYDVIEQLIDIKTTKITKILSSQTLDSEPEINLSQIQEERDMLWAQYQQQGLHLSELRNTRENSGLVHVDQLSQVVEKSALKN